MSLPIESSPRRALRVLDVARAAGVSETTAAAALRGAPVSAATREKVRACAARLGYRPNTAASLLAAQRTSKSELDLVVALLGQHVRADRVVSKLDITARDLGSRLRRHSISPEDAAALGRKLSNEGVDAVWWHALPGDALRNFPRDQFCIVSRHAAHLADGLDVVRAEYFSATRRLLEEVAARGYRRLAVILREHEKDVYDDAARLGAILHFQHTQAAAQGLTVDLLRLPINSPDKVAAGAAVPWIREHKPDVVIGFHRSEKLFLEQTGLRCPRDVGYAAMVVNPDMEGEIAGMLEPQRLELPQVVRRLQDKARLRQFGPSASPVEIVVHPSWSPGSTLPARKSR